MTTVTALMSLWARRGHRDRHRVVDSGTRGRPRDRDSPDRTPSNARPAPHPFDSAEGTAGGLGSLRAGTPGTVSCGESNRSGVSRLRA